MPTAIRDVMTINPITFPASASVVEAARGMRERAGVRRRSGGGHQCGTAERLITKGRW